MTRLPDHDGSHPAEDADLRDLAARLASSERRLSLALSSAHAGVWEWDLDAGLIEVDTRAAAILGLDARASLPVVDVFGRASDVQLEALHLAWSQLFDGSTDRLAHDIELRMDDGRSQWVRVRAHVTATTANGHPTRTTGLVIDITDERQHEEQQRHAQRLDSIGALAAGVAHEINTPLQFVSHNLDFLAAHAATVSGVVDRLMEIRESLLTASTASDLAQRWQTVVEGADLGFIRDEFAAAIVESIEGIDRVTHIVRALKEFAHPGGQGREVVSMNHMIENAITLTRNEWKFVATVETDLDPTLPAVAWAAHECGQLLVNLIVNAAHAIQAVVPKGQKGRITARTRQTGGLVEVQVSDTGSGIPPEIRDRIFEAFFTTKPVGKGTGQGLSTVLAIVKRHGGSIEVDSEVGKGTTFTVRLPPAAGQRVA